LISKENLEKYDSEGMHYAYDTWPDLARDAYNSELQPIDFKNIDHVVFSGMGGSGAIGDLFSSMLSKTDIHTTVVKGYTLPKTVDKNTLVVCTSVSGNTDETLSILKKCTELNCKTIGFSSGNTLESICEKNNIEHRQIPITHSPRTSFPSYVFSILKTIRTIVPIREDEISSCLRNLENVKKEIYSKNLSNNNPSVNLANWISGIPVIYYPWGLEAAAIRFKNSLQENAKTHATIENIIESGHNGIVSWERDSTMTPILLTGTDDHKKTKDRWNIIREYFEIKNIQYKEISTIDGGILSKIMSMIYVLDYCSIYYAIKLGINPSPIESIDFIKERL
jgi:glucose/mannose-6-phosphate isomerase